MNRMSLIVHGGAEDIPDEEVIPAREGCLQAVETGWKMLQNGVTALDVVEEVMKIMEDNPVFDAGRGSFMNANGEIEMDAILVDGMTLRFGAVAAIQRVKNSIVDGKGGIIMMNPHGEIGWACNTRRMTYGWVTPEGRILTDCHEFTTLQT